MLLRTVIKSLLLILTLVISDSCGKKSAYEYPFLDPGLTPEERAEDLVGRLSLEEKIGQMMNAAPAIERLGIPEYNWWNECLHGVARAGLATVFPQAIGLGATWDEELMFDVATAVSDEARAKHHDFARKGKRFIYQGLTFWSPNINIFRDPRWGRGQETYGEDPYLTGKMAVQFVKGLQGDDPTYFKTIATVKHFAVHSGPEPERHSFDAVTNERDFRETYLPQFEMGIKEGKAYSVMCAYNRYNGEACCGSSRLLTTILRDEWGFDGYVVSDCGAIRDIYRDHKVVETPAEASALAVKSGCDLECATVYESLKEAVENGLISEVELDVSLKRLFVARIRLGMFDPPEMVKYAQIPYSVVDSEKNKELAVEATKKSIVLLKNSNNTLPLKKDLKTLAVIGPNSDQWLMLLGNYNGVPSDPITPLRGLREKLSNTNVMYAQGCELAEGMPAFSTIPAENLFSGDGTVKGLYAEYYNNKERTGDVLYSETVPRLDINWTNNAPRDDMDDDNFGVRWSGHIQADQAGEYQLGVITTCKVDLYLNDSLIVNTSYHFRDEFGDPRLRKSVPIRLQKGKKYNIKIEAGESYADAQVQLVWSKSLKNPNEDLKNEAITVARQADAVVMFMGLSARLEGEEMDVAIEGFRGGDRTSLGLPKVQQQLIKEIHALGKPVVLVVLSGSAIALNWENENIPAIIQAWYPGQAAGTAIADVIFGDYNPAGRLPVTFYKSVNDLPAFTEYANGGHTYRYFKGEPLYPFGYGLSYTNFNYEDIQVEDRMSISDSVLLKVKLTNTGKIDGEEIVQVYVANISAEGPKPIRSLKAFKRVALKAGESTNVSFTLPADAFAVYDEQGIKKFKAGTFEVSIGGGQPHTTVRTTSNVLTKMLDIR